MSFAGLGAGGFGSSGHISLMTGGGTGPRLPYYYTRGQQLIEKNKENPEGFMDWFTSQTQSEEQEDPKGQPLNYTKLLNLRQRNKLTGRDQGSGKTKAEEPEPELNENMINLMMKRRNTRIIGRDA